MKKKLLKGWLFRHLNNKLEMKADDTWIRVQYPISTIFVIQEDKLINFLSTAGKKLSTFLKKAYVFAELYKD